MVPGELPVHSVPSVSECGADRFSGRQIERHSPLTRSERAQKREEKTFTAACISYANCAALLPSCEPNTKTHVIMIIVGTYYDCYYCHYDIPFEGTANYIFALEIIIIIAKLLYALLEAGQRCVRWCVKIVNMPVLNLPIWKTNEMFVFGWRSHTYAAMRTFAFISGGIYYFTWWPSAVSRPSQTRIIIITIMLLCITMAHAVEHRAYPMSASALNNYGNMCVWIRFPIWDAAAAAAAPKFASST